VTPLVRVLPVGSVPPHETWLTAAERSRVDRLVHAEDRAAYLSAHVLVRIVAGTFLSEDPATLVLTHVCADCGGGDHGQPLIEGRELHVSLSHTRAMVAAIASPLPCGIDVEGTDATVPPRALTLAERCWATGQPSPTAARAQLWTRKETLMKATGLSLGQALATDVLDRSFGTEFGDRYVASWLPECPHGR